MTKTIRMSQRKVRAVRQQCSTYHSLIKIRLQLQKYLACSARWPHPWLLKTVKDIAVPPEEHTEEDIYEIQDTVGRLFLHLYAKLVPLKKVTFDEGDHFDTFDPLSKRREEILEKLDRWNQSTSLKVDKSFEVLNKSISSQIRYFLENKDEFLKKARPTNLPDDIIGYDLLKQKLGLQQCRNVLTSEIYNDQLFYVQLLRFLTQIGAESDANLREEERQLRNDQSDKPRMSVAKTSKSRRLRYSVIDKLQNFVERTRKKQITNPELVDLIIRSLFKG